MIITRLMTHVKAIHRVKNRKCGWSRWILWACGQVACWTGSGEKEVPAWTFTISPSSSQCLKFCSDLLLDFTVVVRRGQMANTGREYGCLQWQPCSQLHINESWRWTIMSCRYTGACM